MGRSREDLRVYQDTDMTKLLLVFLAVLAVAAITSARQLEQDSSLSEDLAFSRIARSPEADAKRKSRRPKSRASKRKNKSRRQKKRRTRKSKKRGGKRGKKQSKKGTKGRRGSKSRSSVRQINYEECAMKMKDFAGRIKKAGNLDRQAIRINKFKDITSTKKGKKGDFNTTLAALTTALGGNKSAPACRQSGVNFTDQLTTLDNCMTEIEASCTFEMDSNVTAEVTDCQEAGRALFTEVDKCLKPSLALADACSCFGNLTSTNLDKVKSCNITAANSAVTSSKKKCTQGFSACKRAEAGVVDIVDQCKQERKCGGAASKEEAEQQLKILTPLSDALSNTGFADAMSDAGLNTGTGSDGVLSRRHVRQATEDGAACLEILEDWKSFNKSASLAVPGVAAVPSRHHSDQILCVLVCLVPKLRCGGQDHHHRSNLQPLACYDNCCCSKHNRFCRGDNSCCRRNNSCCRGDNSCCRRNNCCCRGNNSCCRGDNCCCRGDNCCCRGDNCCCRRNNCCCRRNNRCCRGNNRCS